MSQPLNVLFITPDQWRWDALSALGGGVPRTPRLDALAAEGVVFGSHFAQCTPCGPSRASLLTGMYMMNHRSVGNGSPLDARFTNIALEARKAGYDPSLIGYTDTSLDPRLHHPDDPVWRRGYEGVLPGFTPLLLMPTDPWEWFRHLESKGYDLPERPYDVYGPEGGHPAVGGFGPYDAPARYRAEDSDTAFSADRAMRFVTENRHQPWFLHLVFLRPHNPYIAPAPYHRMYDPAAVPGFKRAADPGDEARQHPFIAFRQRTRRAVAEMSEDEIRQLRAAYYGLVSEVDDNIGRIVDHLKATGQYDKTLIVVTSDHGDLLGDHWLVGKETFYDQAFHVPAIVRVPGAAWDGGRGRVVEAFTESVDLMPTILDLMGRAVPDQCDGHSLSPFLRGENPASWRSAAF